MKDCIFCKIAAGDIPSYKVFEDDKTIAFLDVNPISKGHTVLIPKAHAETIDKLGNSYTQALGPAQKAVIIKLQDKLNPDGFTIGINHTIGQVVPHLHIHIIPRWRGDRGGSIHSIVHNTPKDSVEAVAKMLKA